MCDSELTLNHDRVPLDIDISVSWLLLQAAVTKYLCKFVIFYLIEAGPAGRCPVAAADSALSLLTHEAPPRCWPRSGQMTGGWRLSLRRARLVLEQEAWSLSWDMWTWEPGQSVACLLGYNSIRANQLVEPCCKKKEMNMTVLPL